FTESSQSRTSSDSRFDRTDFLTKKRFLTLMHTFYEELMRFTNGQFENMTPEQQSRAMDEYDKAVERCRLQSEWKDLCPPGYRNTVPEQLPKLQKFQEVQKWQYGPMGLLVVGPTRRGKTRSVWKLLERLHFDERRSVRVFSPMD